MPTDRRAGINRYIQAKGEVRLSELEKLYPQVSSMTLRRDLEQLEQQGQIVRIRGGAKSLAHLSMIKEAAYTQRQVENTAAKIKIAEKAVTYIQPGRSVFIDSGTTCMCLAQRIPDQNLFLLTSAPNIALELVRNSNCRIHLIGGQLNRETLSLSGYNAIDYLKELNIDLAFMATSAFSLHSGFTCGDYYEAELKKTIIRKAQHVIMLMDRSKIHTGMPFTFASLDQIQTLICDDKLPQDYQEALEEHHIHVI